MTLVYRIIPLLGLALLLGCAEKPEELPTTDTQIAEDQVATASWRERRLALGRETYEEICARCHDEGVDGAPVIGNRETWSDRSQLWSVVLTEHAKAGYLEMPARGGVGELTDEEIEAAGEYMLGETYPELPAD
jgi:cytochrome c5